MWREGLGCYKIITENMQVSYAKHPATLEFKECPQILHRILGKVQGEMFCRGYHPKALPLKKQGNGKRKQWQTYEQQVEILKVKGCKCKV